jgi:chemotaxis protein histidine kinase CheA
MPQIYNKYSFGSELGSSLGTGIGQGLNYLAQNKINQMNQSNDINRYSNLLQQNGVNAEDANVLAYHAVNNPQNFHRILEQYSPVQTQNQNQQQPLQQIGQQTQQQQPQQPQQNLAGLQALNPQQQQAVNPSLRTTKEPEIIAPAVAQQAPQIAPAIQEKIAEAVSGKHKKPGYQQPVYKAPITEGAKEAIQPKQTQEQKQQAEKQQQEVKQAEKVAEKKEDQAAKARTKAQLEELPKLNDKEQAAINKTEKPYIDQVTAKYEWADEAEKRLGRMEKIIEKGGTPVSAIYNQLKSLEHSINPAVASGLGATLGTVLGGGVGAIGLNPVTIGAGGAVGGTTGAIIGGAAGAAIKPIVTLLQDVQKFTSPGLEEFEKLSADFVKGAKAVFGSRLTDTDLKAYMKTVPNLSQTDHGKFEVIQNMRSALKVDRLKYKAMRDIIKENGNKIPERLGFLVEDRTREKVDKLSQEFIGRD